LAVDVSHFWSGDLSLSPTGDIALASGTLLGQQRVIRRLLTNLGDYIWNLDYGAGLPTMIGQPAIQETIEAIIRAQIALEDVVAPTPEPVITVSVGTDGTVYAHIQYADKQTGETQILQFPVQ
jgi:phage baseplate assembly protein W